MQRKIACPRCGHEAELTPDGRIVTHEDAPPCRSVCIASGIAVVDVADLGPPMFSVGCDRCFCTLSVDGQEKWPTAAAAVTAANASGWRGNERFILCPRCAGRI